MAGLMGIDPNALSQIPSDLLARIVSLPANVLNGLVSAPQQYGGIIGGGAPNAPPAAAAPQAPQMAPPPASLVNGSSDTAPASVGAQPSLVATQDSTQPQLGIPTGPAGPDGPTMAPQVPQMGQGPQYGPQGLQPPAGGVVGLLDRLGGGDLSGRRAQNAWLSQQYQMQMYGNFLASLPPGERAAASADLAGYLQSRNTNVSVKPGETELGPAVGGGVFTAGDAGIDPTTGRPWQRQFQYTPADGAPTVGGQLNAGPALGGGKPTVGTNGVMTVIPNPDNPTGILGVSDVPNPAPGQSMAPRVPYLTGGAGGPGGGYAWNPNGPIVPQRGDQPPAAGPPAPAPSAGFATAPSFKSAVALVESRGNPNALNRSTGAAGLYQVTPKRFGGPIPNAAAANSFGEQNLDATLAKYNGDTDRAAVDWFSGPGNVAPPGSPTPWLHNTSDGNMHVSQYVANVRRNMGANAGSQGAQGGVTVPGSTTNGGPLYTIKPGSQVPGGDPNLDYKVNNATQDVTPIDRAVTPTMLGERGKSYAADPVVQGAREAVAAVTGLAGVLGKVGGAAETQAALDSYIKGVSAPNAQVRQGPVQVQLEHQNLVQAIGGEYQRLMTANGGFMSPQAKVQLGRAAWAYANARVQEAAKLDQTNRAYAQTGHQDPGLLGETAPSMPPVPRFLQDPLPPRDQLKVNGVYWSRKGPAVWTGKGWAAQ